MALLTCATLDVNKLNMAGYSYQGGEMRVSLPIIIITLIIAVGVGGTIVLGIRAQRRLSLVQTPSSPSITKTPSQPSTSSPPTVAPTPDQTADWQTYEKKEFGFIFKYPKDWYISELSDFIILSNVKRFITDKPKEGEFILQIEIITKSPTVDIRSYLPGNQDFSSYPLIQVARYPSYQFVIESANNYITHIVVEHPQNQGVALHIQKIARDRDNFNDGNKTFDQVLSTLIFY